MDSQKELVDSRRTYADFSVLTIRLFAEDEGGNKHRLLNRLFLPVGLIES